jgi:phosphoribosylanthranilate isomerase
VTRTRIKICGICRPQDAVAAAEAGADAIGLVFHAAARRNVTVERARAILDVLPPFVTAVGLFVDADVATILRTCRDLSLHHAQLHGHETPEQVAGLAGLTVIKAVRVERDGFGDTLNSWRAAVGSHRLTNLRGLVLETPAAGADGAPGGTGVANDWATVRHHQQHGDFAGLPPVIAAGGLTPETVGTVVRDIRPWAVDVSSGVEESLGVKSRQKLRAFVDAVKQN